MSSAGAIYVMAADRDTVGEDEPPLSNLVEEAGECKFWVLQELGASLCWSTVVELSICAEFLVSPGDAGSAKMAVVTEGAGIAPVEWVQGPLGVCWGSGVCEGDSI